MTNEIIYTNLAAKPKPEAPIVKAPAPALPAKRIRIGWGEEGHDGVAARTEAIAFASANDRIKPKRELGDRSTARVRPSGRLARAMRSESHSYSEAPCRIEMGRVERYSKLERLPEQRLLYEKLERHTARPALEHLTILHSPKAQGYWIADAETGEVFLRQPFATLQHCHEAAVELERTFAIAQVLEMRMPETMESVGELAREHWLRERVAVNLGE